MSWQVNDAEFASVLDLPAPRRYEYFVKRAASHRRLWGLRGGRGWVVAEDDEGDQHFPVWPHQRFAEALATGQWSDATPMAIDIDEWVEEWLPDLVATGYALPCFRHPMTKGWACHHSG